VTLVVGASTASSAELAEPRTLLTERGALIFSDALDQPLAAPWRVSKGSWTIADGAVQVKELKSDMHGAVVRRPLTQANFVIQCSFKLDGTKKTTVSINDPQGHCCRVLIDANGLTVQKDSHDKNQADKAAALDKQTAPIAAGQWHTLVVEVLGPEMLASVDGKLVAFGSHPSIDVAKSNVGLTCAGESVSFKQLSVWEAKPNPGWASTKVELQKNRAAK
jgi:hypothetical protein